MSNLVTLLIVKGFSKKKRENLQIDKIMNIITYIKPIS